MNQALHAEMHAAGLADTVTRCPDGGWQATHPAGHKTIHWTHDGKDWQYRITNPDDDDLGSGACPDTEAGRAKLIAAVGKNITPKAKAAEALPVVEEAPAITG